MVKQKAGNVINISSLGGFAAFPKGAPYAAAKAGVISLTKTLAVEWAPYNIRVNSIAPGIVATGGPVKFAQTDIPSRQEALLKAIPLGRLGEPEDIAGVAIFLASDASAYVSGETITVSGAMTTIVFD